MVEQATHNPLVLGSSPGRPTNKGNIDMTAVKHCVDCAHFKIEHVNPDTGKYLNKTSRKCARVVDHVALGVAELNVDAAEERRFFHANTCGPAAVYFEPKVIERAATCLSAGCCHDKGNNIPFRLPHAIAHYNKTVRKLENFYVYLSIAAIVVGALSFMGYVVYRSQ